MEVCIVGAVLFHGDGQTDRQRDRQIGRQAGRHDKAIVAFRNFANVTKIEGNTG